MANKPVSKLITVLVFLLPPLLMIGAIAIRGYERQRAESANKQAILQLAGEWANYNYLPLTDKSFPDHLKKLMLDSVAHAQLGRDQKSFFLLEQLLFFRAYSEGSYQAYTDFRIPSGFSFNWTSNFYGYGSMDQVLKEREYPAALLTSPMHKKFMALLVALNGDGRVYSNYFTAVDFDHSRIIFQQFSNTIPTPWTTAFLSTNFDSQVSRSVKAPFPNMGYYSPKENHAEVIQFTADRIEQIVSKFGVVTVADCLFFIKRKEPDPALPLILRLYWNPKAMRWLPDDLVTCNMVQKGIQPVF